jgi:hypothetical protein
MSAFDPRQTLQNNRRDLNLGFKQAVGAARVSVVLRWFDGPTCRPGNRHVGRDESKAIGFLTWAGGFAMFPQISSCLHSLLQRNLWPGHWKGVGASFFPRRLGLSRKQEERVRVRQQRADPRITARVRQL